jgi:hypothetical protein
MQSKQMITAKDVIEILGGEKVDEIREEPLSPTGRLLLKFLKVSVKQLEEYYEQGRRLRGDDQQIVPGDCETCPAYSEWPDHEAKYYCFYDAYFGGRSAKAVPARRENCRLLPDNGMVLGQPYKDGLVIPIGKIV